jgi:hypothetical protein
MADPVDLPEEQMPLSEPSSSAPADKMGPHNTDETMALKDHPVDHDNISQTSRAEVDAEVPDIPPATDESPVEGPASLSSAINTRAIHLASTAPEGSPTPTVIPQEIATDDSAMQITLPTEPATVSFTYGLLPPLFS